MIFIRYLTTIVSKEEITFELFNIMQSVIRSDNCSLPVKKLVAEILSNQITSSSNFALRFYISDMIIKEIATNNSS